MRKFRTETIQIAAVATAIVEDLDGGHTSSQFGWSESVLDEVLDERHRQNEKWGDQHHHPALWLLILMEEVGEAAYELLDKLDEVDPETAMLVAKISGVGLGVRDYLNEKVFT